MLADFVTPQHRKLVRSRFLTYPVIATLTMLICFWSIELSLGVYLALLPLYMIPGKFGQQHDDISRLAEENADYSVPPTPSVGTETSR
jgi:hypothetical protein